MIQILILTESFVRNVYLSFPRRNIGCHSSKWSTSILKRRIFSLLMFFFFHQSDWDRDNHPRRKSFAILSVSNEEEESKTLLLGWMKTVDLWKTHVHVRSYVSFGVEMEIKRVVQDPENLTVISLPTCPPFFRPSTSASIVVHSTLSSADYVYRKMHLHERMCVHINMKLVRRRGTKHRVVDGVFARNV